MPRITAVVHTHNDGLRLGRCLETVYPCDEVLIIDHGSNDDTQQIARDYGAKVVGAAASVQSCIEEGWILCLDPRESLTESLSASLYEWKTEPLRSDVATFAAMLREETSEGWIEHPAAQTRLVPVNWQRWRGRLPAEDPAAIVLQGEILRFTLP